MIIAHSLVSEMKGVCEVAGIYCTVPGRSTSLCGIRIQTESGLENYRFCSHSFITVTFHCSLNQNINNKNPDHNCLVSTMCDLHPQRLRQFKSWVTSRDTQGWLFTACPSICSQCLGPSVLPGENTLGCDLSLCLIFELW